MQSKSEVVYQDLRRRVTSGEYSAGYRLVLARLAGQYQCSVVPVREALRRLEAEGLVRYTLNVGAEVIGVNAGDYAETMQTLAHLEGVATALAAPELTAADLAEARAINDQMRLVRQDLDPVAFTRLNQTFHQVICHRCPNGHLVDLLRREWDRMSQIRSSTFAFVPERSSTSVEEHDRLLDLIESGAPALEIELAAREHKLRTMYRFLDHQDDHAARVAVGA